ncbi:diguanylate cyclase [Candidatus Shapirobacteria bacterium]|nr:diguanylate cyclase [Candidatus Shapirobacteria bacterium]
MAEQRDSSFKNEITPQDVKKMTHKIADFFDNSKNPEIDQKRYEQRFENWKKYLKTLDKMESEQILTHDEKNYIIVNLIVKNEFDAEHDFLTGLYNRDGFEKRSLELLNESKHKKTPLTLIAIDIDNFKGLNDERSHDEGDSF